MPLTKRSAHRCPTTGNKSELAVGYRTLYGDRCGGLAVISDVHKTMVYKISNWINREREIIPPASLTKALPSGTAARTRPTRFAAALRCAGCHFGGVWQMSRIARKSFAPATTKKTVRRMMRWW